MQGFCYQMFVYDPEKIETAIDKAKNLVRQLGTDHLVITPDHCFLVEVGNLEGDLYKRYLDEVENVCTGIDYRCGKRGFIRNTLIRCLSWLERNQSKKQAAKILGGRQGILQNTQR